MSATQDVSARSAAEVLGTPWRIDGLGIKNRFVLGPMAVLRPTPEGHPSDQSIAFLTTRARGGVGLIIVGGTVGTDRGNAEAPFRTSEVICDRPEYERLAAEHPDAGSFFPAYRAP